VRAILAAVALLAFACGGGDRQSVVVVNVSADPPLPSAHQLDITVGQVTRTFDAPAGVGPTPVGFGVYIDAALGGTVDVTVIAHTPGEACTTHEGSAQVEVLGGHKGAVVRVDVTVSRASGCNADGGVAEGGLPPDAGRPGPDAPSGDTRPVDGPVDVPVPPPDTPPPSPDLPPPINPPSLSRCTSYDHGPMDCSPMTFPFQRVLAVFSPDGSQVVSSGLDDGIKFWKVSGGALSPDGRTLSATGQAVVAFSPDGGQLAVGAGSGQLYLFDLKAGAQHALVGHTDHVRGVAFIRDGARLWSVDRGGSLRSWDVAQRSAIGNPITIPGVPSALALVQGSGDLWAAVAIAHDSNAAIPDGGADVAAGAHVYLVDLVDPSRHALLDLDTTTDSDLEVGMAVSPDGKLLAAGGGDTVVKVWDITNRTNPVKVKDLPPLMLANGNTEAVTALAFSPDGRFLAAGHGEIFTGSRIRLFEVASYQMRNERDPQTWWPISLAFSPSGGALVAGLVNCNQIYYCQD
jgi:hypothetical protein